MLLLILSSLYTSTHHITSHNNNYNHNHFGFLSEFLIINREMFLSIEGFSMNMARQNIDQNSDSTQKRNVVLINCHHSRRNNNNIHYNNKAQMIGK